MTQKSLLYQLNYTLRKLYFHFLSNRMGYDRGDSCPLDFEPNGIPFGSKSKGKGIGNIVLTVYRMLLAAFSIAVLIAL